MVSINEAQTSTKAARLRPLDLTRDLDQVADLIEICFSSHMDPDGREYLRQMRRMAHDAYLLRRAVQATGSPYSPLAGYVWEEEGNIIGNLSLIPAGRLGRRIYLIANVAVHPDFRRRGIARALTETAIQKARLQNANSCWLQVREDNLHAIDLYRSLGFIERTRRSTWLSRSGFPSRYPTDKGISIAARSAADWPRQKEWLSAIYPDEVTWNLYLDVDRFKPGFWNALSQFLTVENIRHWSARVRSELIGVLTWQPSRSFADSLWLATTAENEDRAIPSLLSHARGVLNSSRPLSLNYPAHRAEEALENAGFILHQTLMWMELPFETTRRIIVR